MQKIKILLPYSTGPDVTSFYSIFFDHVLPELKKKINIELIWFVYKPEKKISKKTNDDIRIIYFQDYNDALDVLKKEEPDLLFLSPWPDFIGNAFLLAAKSLKISTMSIIFLHYYPSNTFSKMIGNYIKRFLESSIPTDTSEDKKTPMRRGMFFLKKYFFLAKTQKILGYNQFKIFQDFLMYLKLLLFETKSILDPRFATDIHFVADPFRMNSFITSGFEKSSMILTGNPIYDSTFHRFSKQVVTSRDDKKIHVLFAPSTLYESGNWTKQQRNYVISEIINAIVKNKDQIKLTVKIHPSTSKLSDYESIIHSIDKSIPVIQNGDIRDFLEDTDVYVSSEISSGEFFSVIAKKPIILCQFFKPTSNIMLEHNLAVSCTNSQELVKLIHSITLNPPKEEDRQRFIQKYLYKDDGKASERVSDEIIKLFKKNSSFDN